MRMIEISYIAVNEVPGDEFPVRIEAYVPGNNLRPQFRGMGKDLDGALRGIQTFSGRSLDYLRSKIHGMIQ